MFFCNVVFQMNDPEKLRKEKAEMISLVVNKGVLVVRHTSVVKNLNCMQGRGEGVGDGVGPLLE